MKSPFCKLTVDRSVLCLCNRPKRCRIWRIRIFRRLDKDIMTKKTTSVISSEDPIIPSFGTPVLLKAPGRLLSHVITCAAINRRQQLQSTSCPTRFLHLLSSGFCLCLHLCLSWFHCSLALLLSYVEQNPGPDSKFLCLICGKSVISNQDGLQCDGCDNLFHRKCESVSKSVYVSLAKSDDEWYCGWCALPNLLDSFFECDTVLDISSPDDTVSQPKPQDVAHIPMVKQGLLVVHLNCRSVYSKLKDLLIGWLGGGHNVALGLSETWLSESVDDAVVGVDGYEVYRRDMVGKAGGGVLVFVSNIIKSVKRMDLEVEGVELIWVEVTVSGRHFLVGDVHRPPSPPPQVIPRMARLTAYRY